MSGAAVNRLHNLNTWLIHWLSSCSYLQPTLQILFNRTEIRLITNSFHPLTNRYLWVHGLEEEILTDANLPNSCLNAHNCLKRSITNISTSQRLTNSHHNICHKKTVVNCINIEFSSWSLPQLSRPVGPTGLNKSAILILWTGGAPRSRLFAIVIRENVKSVVTPNSATITSVRPCTSGILVVH